MTPPFPPASRESCEAADALLRKIEQAQAEHAALPPVDRALAEIDQRNSWVRGVYPNAKDDDAGSVLANEVRRLRRLLGPLTQADKGPAT